MDAGDPDGNSILFQLLFLAFLTLVNAFFAGAEMAVVSVNKNRIKVLADEGSKRAALLQTLFEDSTKFLSTIQVAITLAGFFSSASASHEKAHRCSFHPAQRTLLSKELGCPLPQRTSFSLQSSHLLLEESR